LFLIFFLLRLLLHSLVFDSGIIERWRGNSCTTNRSWSVLLLRSCIVDCLSCLISYVLWLALLSF
jgi:hypothetical protein